MSLKKLVLLLLVINLGYFIYSQGWLQSLLGSDKSQREPERIVKQINLEAIVVKPTSANTKPPVSVPTSPAAITNACLQDREQWMVYMGPYASAALGDKKKSELKKIGVASKDVSKAQLPIGLSLGQFDNETAAREELKRLGSKGVRTATVILWDKVTVPCANSEKP